MVGGAGVNKKGDEKTKLVDMEKVKEYATKAVAMI
jgi:hypothetical protein